MGDGRGRLLTRDARCEIYPCGRLEMRDISLWEKITLSFIGRWEISSPRLLHSPTHHGMTPCLVTSYPHSVTLLKVKTINAAVNKLIVNDVLNLSITNGTIFYLYLGFLNMLKMCSERYALHIICSVSALVRPKPHVGRYLKKSI